MPIRPETDDLIAFLNELAALDPVFMGRLLSARLPCNDAILNHPSVQASVAKDYRAAKYAHNRPSGIDDMPDNQGIAGVLGVLNGFCGTFDDGPRKAWGPIAAVIEDDGTVSSFRRTDQDG